MNAFMNPALQGAGRITGVFFHPAGDFVAVASAFPLLINPPARAAYGGAALRYRVGLYRRGEPAPFAACDAPRLPINDVAFHPDQPVIAIGGGSYDGGYMFEGELIAWNWDSGACHRPFLNVPEVVRCRYLQDGRIEAWVRPWDESWDEQDDDVPAASKTLLRVETAAGVATPELDPATATLDHATPPDVGDAAKRLADWLGLPELGLRGAIWDLAWLDADTLAAVHDACLLDRYRADGALVARHDGGGRGGEILRATPLVVHAIAPPDPADRFRRDSRLYALRDGALTALRDEDGQYTFCAGADGRLLGRRDRIDARRRTAGDVLLDPTLTGERRLDLGHYDCFNHYIGINGAPDLFSLQGTPPGSHEGKHLCRVHADGRLERLWPLLKPDGTPASHAMECRGAYVDDALGASVVIAGKHYSPTVGNAYRGFIYRKSLARGQERWRHATPASASAIIVADGLVLAAFLDGTLMLIDAASGDLLLASRVRIGGVATVLYALAAHGGRLAVGAIDGRIALVDLAALAGMRPTRGGIDLA
ncbi:PQQ-binding-like beta-propeller repeat protein [Achromobacter ruhlandii]|uniref:PQQ-binding-like beta-propeller repeat protein n=1 Tax=Achromobacter ruhlandii TaxID=72557 RepID=UPI000C25D015|nr:PQQ-binding-like beta-propeller repeat protein [Achromobacter ruhlandii]PJM69770.1 hypothetical protein CV751_13935 [Achromobacter ruhlandii]